MIMTVAALTVAALLGIPTQPPEPFTVHEWGTFTSFSGPRDPHVVHRLRIAEDLPAWVQARFVGERWMNADTGDFQKWALSSKYRMETPVIYFHAPQPMEVSVEVQMPKGLITEVYPPVSATLPLKLENPEVPEAGSMVRWDRVWIEQQPCCGGVSFKDAGSSHYAQARKTNGDVVHVKGSDGEHKERFLFYRGVGNMDLNVNVIPMGGDVFKVVTDHPNLRATAFAVENWAGVFRFSEYHNVVSDSDLQLRQAATPVSFGTYQVAAFPTGTPNPNLAMTKQGTSAAELATAMTKALVESGLNQDEAAAMVATWKHHWFDEEGTRVLMILPQSIVDTHLPLTITPTPAKTTRVFVSRLEVLTPERVFWVRNLIAQKPETPDAKAKVEAELKKLGRFREAAVKIAEQPFDLNDGC
jgi:hypothetical protein